MLWIMGAEDAHNQLNNYFNNLHEQITTLKGENADLKKIVEQFASLASTARDLVYRFNGGSHETVEATEAEEASP